MLNCFGDLSEDLVVKKQYAKRKAMYLNKCFQTGETPIPGPLVGGRSFFDELMSDQKFFYGFMVISRHFKEGFGDDETSGGDGGGGESQPTQPQPPPHHQQYGSDYGQPSVSNYNMPSPTNRPSSSSKANNTSPPAAAANYGGQEEKADIQNSASLIYIH